MQGEQSRSRRSNDGERDDVAGTDEIDADGVVTALQDHCLPLGVEAGGTLLDVAWSPTSRGRQG